MNYVIGDIHGQLDALKNLLKIIEYNNDTDTLYFVGDYIDWGDKSIETLLFVMTLSLKSNVYCMIGNHDKLMLDTLYQFSLPKEEANNYTMSIWLNNGGYRTIQQYEGLDKETQDKIYQWLNNLLYYKEININNQNYFIAHAYCITKKNYLQDNRAKEDFVWKRLKIHENPFSYAEEKYKDYILICGHTFSCYYSNKNEIYYDTKFIDVDCGAKLIGQDASNYCYPDGRLAALRLEDMKEFYVEK